MQTGSKTTPIGFDPNRLKRIVRRAIWAAVAALVVYVFVRFSFATVPGANDALSPFAPGGSRVLLDRFFGVPYNGMRIVYSAPGDVAGGSFLGRIAAGPGASLAFDGRTLIVGGEEYELDGESAEFWSKRNLGTAVPDGYYFIVNENAESGYPDSRRLGLVARGEIEHRVVMRLPF